MIVRALAVIAAIVGAARNDGRARRGGGTRSDGCPVPESNLEN